MLNFASFVVRVYTFQDDVHNEKRNNICLFIFCNKFLLLVELFQKKRARYEEQTLKV